MVFVNNKRYSGIWDAPDQPIYKGIVKCKKEGDLVVLVPEDSRWTPFLVNPKVTPEIAVKYKEVQSES